MQCAFCKDIIDDDSFYCDMCGEEVKICPNCNKAGKGKACTACGKLLVMAKDVTQSASAKSDGSDIIISGSSPAEKQNGGTVRISENSPNIDSSASQPSLHLINKNININLAIVENSVLGRVQGDYVPIFNKYGEVSGKHCRFSFDTNNGWQVTDIGSTNGTYLNKSKLMPNISQRLKDKMFLKIANIEFYISIE